MESHGLIVGYEDPKPEKHLHASIWHLWNDRIALAKKNPTFSYEDALALLLEKTLDACVLVSDREVGKWFRWDGRLIEAKEKLVASGKILRTGSFLVIPRIAR